MHAKESVIHGKSFHKTKNAGFKVPPHARSVCDSSSTCLLSIYITLRLSITTHLKIERLCRSCHSMQTGDRWGLIWQCPVESLHCYMHNLSDKCYLPEWRVNAAVFHPWTIRISQLHAVPAGKKQSFHLSTGLYQDSSNHVRSNSTYKSTFIYYFSCNVNFQFILFVYL